MKNLFQSAYAELLSVREDLWSTVGEIGDTLSMPWVVGIAKRHQDGISARKWLNTLETATGRHDAIMIDYMTQRIRGDFRAAGKPVTKRSRMDKRIERAARRANILSGEDGIRTIESAVVVRNYGNESIIHMGKEGIYVVKTAAIYNRNGNFPFDYRVRKIYQNIEAAAQPIAEGSPQDKRVQGAISSLQRRALAFRPS